MERLTAAEHSNSRAQLRHWSISVAEACFANNENHCTAFIASGRQRGNGCEWLPQRVQARAWLPGPSPRLLAHGTLRPLPDLQLLLGAIGLALKHWMRPAACDLPR